MPSSNVTPAKPGDHRVVIVGAGFGGLLAARQLTDSRIQVTVVDRTNHHLFQPLLYQVATAGLSPAQIATPIRSILRRQSNIQVVMGEVVGVDSKERFVRLRDGALPYDSLVLAPGAHYSYFGHEDWKPFARALKTVPDAIDIRSNVLLAFERAETEPDEAARSALLTFVIVGGGPTGVELAGALAELAHRALSADFRKIRSSSAKIILAEASPKILAGFPDPLASSARKALEKLGVQVRTSATVTSVRKEGVQVGAEWIPSRTVLWAAGIAAAPAAQWLEAKADRAGRVLVEPDLTVPGHPDIFVIGDSACVIGQDGKALPAVAPVAMQEGQYVGKRIVVRLRGDQDLQPFRYRFKGNLATVGRSFAIADFGKVRFTGLFAWIFWLLLHVYYLIGFRNRILVMIDWAWSYVTFQRGARLITTAPKNGTTPPE